MPSVPKPRLPVLACALLSGGLWLAPQPAAACSQIEPLPFVIDPALAQADATAPTPFRGITASTHRIAGEHCVDKQCTRSSCGDVGFVELRFEPPQDAGAEGADLGYRIVWLSGKMPEAMRRELDVIRPLNAGGSLTLDAGFGGITELDGELALIAVDRAGNESEPSEAVRVQWSGCTEYFDEPTCSTVSSSQCSVQGVGEPAHGSRSVWAVALTLVMGRLRRRTRTR